MCYNDFSILGDYMKDKNKKKDKNKNSKGYYVFILLIIVIFVLILWSRYISTTGLSVREYAVINEKLPESFNGFKVVHFSDLHYKSTIFESELKKLVEDINELKPDIAVFTGDLIEKREEVNEKDIEILIKYLNMIDTNIGKYAVKGNHDYASLYFDAIFESTDFKVLKNSSELIYYNGNIPIYLVGLDDSLEGKVDLSIINNESDYYSILLSHEPDIYDKVKEYNFDLILAGHSHNGQIRIPFFGAIYKVKGAKKYYDPHYVLDKTEIFISGGLGTSKYKFRFLNKPSYNLYRLYNK